MNRILFIGLGESTHTESWINLLKNSDLTYCLFALPTGAVPVGKDIPTYCSGYSFFRSTGSEKFLKAGSFLFSMILLIRGTQKIQLILSRITKHSKGKLIRGIVNQTWFKYDSDSIVLMELRRFIKSFQPNIIHTLGIFESSVLYLKLHSEFPDVIWVTQVRGGPDLELFQHDEEKQERISRVLQASNFIICDSQSNYALAHDLGADITKFSLGVISGTGGMDLDNLSTRPNQTRTSRIVLWPKAYEALSAKGSPVIEGIKLAWDYIQPAQFVFLWADQPEFRLWMRRELPDYIFDSIEIRGRVSRDEALNYVSNAQVLLSPSLMDGVPNSMLEAMAYGAIPIVSPLPTIESFVNEGTNVFFARNLYPTEIRDALIQAMGGGPENNQMIINNFNLIEKYYNRTEIQERVINFYTMTPNAI